MSVTDLLTKIKALFAESGGVDVSFGKASEVNGVTVIPVAKVGFGFGGGEGKAGRRRKGKKPVEKVKTEPSEEGKKAEDYGLGFGGGASTIPLGIFVINEGKTQFHPVVTIEKVFGFGLLFLLSILIFGPKNKK